MALFPDGILWLRVGKGEGAPDRLPALMQRLAEALHEDVLGKRTDAPVAAEDGETYIRNIFSQETLRCLVVTNDVWEAEVVNALRKTGMWEILTTRVALMVEPKKG